MTQLCKGSNETKFSNYEPDMIQVNSEVLLVPWLSILVDPPHPLELFVFLLFICLLYDQMKLCYKREP